MPYHKDMIWPFDAVSRKPSDAPSQATPDVARASPQALARLMVHQQLVRRGIDDPRVLLVMEQVPRHHFVPDRTLAEAYSDHALPTLHGQTISQPYIVARMTQLLDVEQGMKVLEVGTGSGYQTAILAALGATVVSIEADADLAAQARDLLMQLYPQAAITIHVGDGTLGCPQHAPYDRILITAAAPRPPQACLTQLAEHGRMVVPIGTREHQNLTVLTPAATGWNQTRDIACRFVPLIGKDGWDAT